MMAENFDPYYKWLGIAPAEQPANHYRLLGLNLFEPDLDVIESGSDRQMTHLRSFQTGPRMRECQQLLNEVAAARVVLLDAPRKAAYDQALRASLTPAEAPPPVNTVPLTPADTLLPTAFDSAAPAKAFSRLSSAKATSPAVVAKGTRRLRTQSMSVGTLVAGGVIGLVAVLACGYGLRLAFQPRPVPIKPQAKRDAEITPSPRVAAIEPDEQPAAPRPTPPVERPAEPPVEPEVEPAVASRPANALGDVLDEYNCTLTSQPQLAIDSSFDATKSWRLSMRVNASSHPAGTLFTWGDSRPGKDPICIKAGPNLIDGWVVDNTRSDKATGLPKIPIDWSAWHEIELVHDAVAQVVQLRVDDERRNVSVIHPPRPDRDMPVYLGGIGVGALHAFPCRLRDLRLEQLTDPVELSAPSVPAVRPEPAVAANGKSPKMPDQNGTLGDLVNPMGDPKLSVPAEPALQAAREQIQRLFAFNTNEKRTPQESAKLADDLVDQAIQSGTQPAMRYVMLEAAIDIAVQSGAVASASKAFQELDKAFSVDLVQLKADAARKIARVAKEPWEHKAVAELLEVVIDECLADDRFEVATPLAETALDAARKSRDSSTTTRLAARSRDIKSLNAKYAPVRAALEVLAGGSDDPAAHETMGRHLCLVKGKWNEGLPHLVKSDSSELRDIAARDIRNPTNPDSQTAIGDDWLKVVSQLDRSLQLQALLRAEHWYRTALPQASGLKKLPLETHINELGKQVGELAELPPGAVMVMTFEPSTLKRQGYVLDVSQHGYVGVVRGAILADGVAGKALAFDGKK
ncbi:MAG: hypothetical protein O3C40_19415 [Planctomycetota bacterium]|nr:hypothetical protein [Planctomycetota bacterium]